jgi:hypothetical protein
MYMNFHEQFQITVRLDGDNFLQYYLPGKATTVSSENMTLWEDFIALQDKLEVFGKGCSIGRDQCILVVSVSACIRERPYPGT